MMLLLRRHSGGRIDCAASSGTALSGAASGLLLLLERQPLVGGVGEGRRDHHDRAGRHERAHHAASDDLPLPSGEVDGEAGGPRRGGAGEEGPREGEDLEPALQHHRRARGGRLADGDVGDGAAAAEDADAALAAAREVGDALRHVGAAGHLHHVAAEGVRAVPGHEDRRLRFVLRTGRPPPGAARPHLHRPLLGLVVAAAVAVIIVVAAAAAPAAALLVDRKLHLSLAVDQRTRFRSR